MIGVYLVRREKPGISRCGLIVSLYSITLIHTYSWSHPHVDSLHCVFKHSFGNYSITAWLNLLDMMLVMLPDIEKWFREMYYVIWNWCHGCDPFSIIECKQKLIWMLFPLFFSMTQWNKVKHLHAGFCVGSTYLLILVKHGYSDGDFLLWMEGDGMNRTCDLWSMFFSRLPNNV